MRAIESKKEMEKRQKKNQLIIGGILIFVMLGSTFGYAFYQLGNDEAGGKVEYNGYKFIESNGLWTAKIGNYDFWFAYNPTQVERIDAEVRYLNSYSGLPLYFFTESEDAGTEIYRNLQNTVQRFQVACLEEKNCPEEWPIRDCSNNFIIIKEANESRIYQKDNCAFIEGPRENLTQITDEFLFRITGIEG